MKYNLTRRRLSIIICAALAVVILGTAAVIHAANGQQTGMPSHGHPAKTSPSPASSPSPSVTPAPSPAPTVSPAPANTFNVSHYSHTDPASIWVVVNKQHPLAPISYAPSDLVGVGGGQTMRTEAAGALSSMFAAARQAGLTLSAASAYRSYTTQVAVYDKEVADYGQATADSESARPGYSEHQTGLAVDIAGGGCSITDCFGNTAEGKWAAANAYTYGFILRYTAANSATTGYRAESWHFRYVGTELSNHMHDSGVTTLEEVFGVSGGPNY